MVLRRLVGSEAGGGGRRSFGDLVSDLWFEQLLLCVGHPTSPFELVGYPGVFKLHSNSKEGCRLPSFEEGVFAFRVLDNNPSKPARILPLLRFLLPFSFPRLVARALA